MKLEKLRLKGFTGIKRGLGLDEIEIDFTTVLGLTAFDGVNGCGKSTCLENLHPYPQLASREGALYQHVFARDAEKELSFIYQGDHYRTLVKIDCQSGKSEGYVYKNHNTASETNGKITEYNKYVRGLFGSPDLFFASVFCAQNAAKLSDLTTGQLKGLFAEFLRLERYTAWEDTAKQAGNILQGKLGQIDQRITTLQDVASKHDDIKATYLSAGEKAEFLRDDKTLLEHDLSEKRDKVSALKETISKNALAIQRKQDIEAQIKRLEDDLAREKAVAKDEIDLLSGKWSVIQHGIADAAAILQDREKIEKAAEKQRELEGKLSHYQSELDRLNAENNQSQLACHALEAETQKLNQQCKDLRNDQEIAQIEKDIVEARHEEQRLSSELKACEIDPELMALKSQLTHLQKSTQALEQKDPKCQSVSCSFIVDALRAKDEIPVVQNQIKDSEQRIEATRKSLQQALDAISVKLLELSERHGKRSEQIAKEVSFLETGKTQKEGSLQEEKQNLQRITAHLIEAQRAIAITKSDMENQKKLSARLPEIQLAEARKADLEKQLSEVTEQGLQRREGWIVREKFLASEIETHQGWIDDISCKIDCTAETILKNVHKEIEDIEAVKLPALEKEIQAAREKIATLQAELRRIEEAEKEQAEARATRDSLTVEISEWRYLQTACGKNGLQALEIDGAAPLITSIANQLLSQAFGPLFSVKLITQDDNGKECLDIVVISEDGEEILLENLSGGQKVWVLMALRLAMTLLSKEKSGHNFETFFADELDGPLDPENSLNFMAMYQAFMEIGKFKAGYFISHKPSCRNLADNVLRFEAGNNPAWG